LITTGGTRARVVTKVLPWDPNEAYPVVPVKPGGYLFFSAAEAAVVDASPTIRRPVSANGRLMKSSNISKTVRPGPASPAGR
jgi:gluconate 2-dehydrogenase gamma chain